MKFNINGYVKIKLTFHGKEILQYQHDELVKSFGNGVPKELQKFHLPKEDKDGWSKWQLWQVMETFGGFVGLGSEPPFETSIDIPEYNNLGE